MQRLRCGHALLPLPHNAGGLEAFFLSPSHEEINISPEKNGLQEACFPRPDEQFSTR